MEIKCQKCGAAASDEQAFCQKCGAVLGMGDAGGRDDAAPNLAATVVGKFPFPPPPSRPPASQPPQPQGVTPVTPAAPARAPQAPAPAPPRPAPVAPPPPSQPPAPQPRGSNTTLLVIIGFVAVLLVGGLLIFLLLYNLQS